jgi:RHS repeat-associated protein
MQWDFAEKLSHITQGTTEAYYNYDGSGQRVRKVVEKNNVIEERLYLGGFEIFRKRVNGNLDTERETLHIMDDVKRIAIVETKTVDNGTIINNPTPIQRYQLSNNIESATLELDDAANIISYEEYYPYGETSYRAGRNIAEVGLKRYRYTGKEKDEESGLYYYGARYYICWLGRWTATDPAGLVDGLNLYMYCRGSPVGLVDRDGTQRSGPSPNHDVSEQLMGGPVDPACTFNCGKSINGESQGEGTKKPAEKQVAQETKELELETVDVIADETIDVMSEDETLAFDDVDVKDAVEGIETEQEDVNLEVTSNGFQLPQKDEIIRNAIVVGGSAILSKKEAFYKNKAEEAEKTAERAKKANKVAKRRSEGTKEGTNQYEKTKRNVKNTKRAVKNATEVAQKNKIITKILKGTNVAFIAAFGIYDVYEKIKEEKPESAMFSAGLTAASIAALFLISPGFVSTIVTGVILTIIYYAGLYALDN